MQIKFGEKNKTTVIDDEGSTCEQNNKYVDYATKGPAKVQYKIRFRVHDQKEELAEYMKFSDDINLNRNYLDPCVYIEHVSLGDKSGYYYLVKCYTILEY